ncbi:MAG: 50S ribosomal protein L20 [bacterium]|nr:50S ribosomal protein L20 [bacterium]
MRVKKGITKRKRHKKILKAAKGMSHIRTASYRKANEAVIKALSYQYRDRRNLKRDMRSLWIIRISAAAKTHGTSYSQLIARLKKADIKINRKILAELSVNQPKAFEAILKEVK